MISQGEIDELYETGRAFIGASFTVGDLIAALDEIGVNPYDVEVRNDRNEYDEILFHITNKDYKERS